MDPQGARTCGRTEGARGSSSKAGAQEPRPAAVTSPGKSEFSPSAIFTIFRVSLDSFLLTGIQVNSSSLCLVPPLKGCSLHIC